MRLEMKNYKMILMEKQKKHLHDASASPKIDKDKFLKSE